MCSLKFPVIVRRVMEAAAVSEQDARRAAKRAIDARWTRASFAKKAKIDPGTLTDFLEGVRWPQGRSRAKIEETLGWPIGSLDDLREGVPFDVAVGPAGHTPTHAAAGGRAQRELSNLRDLTLEELAEEQRRIADEMTRRLRERGP